MSSADQYTINELGIPSLVLMERAARSCVDVMEDAALDLSHVCIVCGSGNNGGDGFAIARMLTEKGCQVTTCFVGNESHCTEETNKQMELLKSVGGIITNGYVEADYSVIVDAVFGVGLSRDIQGSYQNVIRQMNCSEAVKFAVDMPSGISADLGQILGIAFHADITVTFQCEKLGQTLYPGKEYAGQVIVKDIGISTDRLAENMKVAYTYDREDYARLLPVRKEDSNKGTYGKLLVIAGSKGMSGAAFLNSMAAYMAGAGLVQIYTPESNRVILQELIPEAIITTYKEYDKIDVQKLLDWADVICIGSGIGTSETSWKILEHVLEMAKVPCLIDADGLNLLSEHRDAMQKLENGNYVLTPHMKEMSRLLDVPVSDIKANRMQLLDEYVQKYHVTCVLKDARTIVYAKQGVPYVNLSGNSAMAKAGSGDVLAGIIAGLLAQGMNTVDAASLGVYLHGRSGDFARKEKGSYSVLARDLIQYLSAVLKEQEEILHENIH
jgi:NAD(P)H-hydrate epimerase